MSVKIALRQYGQRQSWRPNASLFKARLQPKHASTIADRKWSTPLAKTIAQAIATTGPISIANYMRQCLTSPDGGYYTRREEHKDQFGAKGDFITSPEISQVFGELVGLWFLSEWIMQGKVSKGVEIIELGPGRGTLMDDMLRTLSNFREFASAVDCVYLVEASPSLRESQRRLLCGDAPSEKTEIGVRSRSKYSDLPITWCEDIRLVPKGPLTTPFMIAHEFFDAMPIYAFQTVSPEIEGPSQTIETPTGTLPLPRKSSESKQPSWRELLVTTKAQKTSLYVPQKAQKNSTGHDEYELTLAKASTPTSTLLPKISPRYEALRRVPNSTMEVSPDSHSYAADVARRIGGATPQNQSQTAKATAPEPQKATPSGAALIIDYGPADTVPISTLRGMQAHRKVSPFVSPGLVDLSADVDFVALADAALAASPGVEVHGPLEQGTWLEAMGIRARADMISQNVEGGEEGKKRVMGAVERLVERGGGGMGRLYKTMAIVPERGGRRPVGFGGDLGRTM